MLQLQTKRQGCGVEGAGATTRLYEEQINTSKSKCGTAENSKNEKLLLTRQRFDTLEI